MAEEDVDWGMDDFDPWQGAEEQVNGSSTVERLGGESINQDVRMEQDRGLPSSNVGKVESTAGIQQRLAIGWTIRTSRSDPAKQYFYNPYTQATTWEQPQEPPIDESGITTPPLPQLRQEPSTSLQIRSSGRLTDHMKMAPIQQQPIEVKSTSSTPANSGRREMRSGKPSDASDAQGPAANPSKLRLIDRIQPVRYTPPEKSLSLRSSNGSVSRASPAPPSHRSERAASGANAIPAESSKSRDSSHPERAKPSPLHLTSQSSQPSTGPNDAQSKEDAFASQKYAEKMPEWLEANDPKLDSDDLSRRRMRSNDDTSMGSGASKRARLDPESVVVKGSGSTAKSEDRSARQDNRTHVTESYNASTSRLNDKRNSRDAPLSDRDRTRPSESGKHADIGSTPRTTGIDHIHPDRQAVDGSRTAGARDPPRFKADDRKFASASAPDDRGRAMPPSANSLGPRGNRGSPPFQAPPPPSASGSREVRPSGSNTAPLVANRWAGAAQTHSSKSSEAQTSAGLSRNDQTIDHARIGKSTTNTLRPSQISAETYKSKEYAYGPKASKNNGAPPLSNEGARHMSGPGPAIHPPLNLNSRRMAASPPPPTRPLMDISPQMPGPNPQSGFFAPNGSSMSAREGNSYRPDPPTRDAWLNNSRSPAVPGYGSKLDRASRFPLEPQGPIPDTRRGDPSFDNAPSTRPSAPAPVGRARSPVPHLTPQGRIFALDRAGPPRRSPSPGRFRPGPLRRSPSPGRFGPAPPVRFGDRRDDRITRTPDTLAPMPSPRDVARPHPRAPDLYTPGGRSPPRQSPRPPVPPFAFSDSARDQRFDARRGPPPGRGPSGHR